LSIAKVSNSLNFDVIEDKRDTKKIRNHLKSLTKFYDTFRVFDFENNNVENRKQVISIQGLVEMAKEVSDKMVINKIKVCLYHFNGL
jgi:hypothetical protein